MDNQELLHWGIKGMKWGQRRFQNRDGTLTAAGKKRYNKEMARLREEEKVLKNKEATKAKLDKLEAKRADLDARKKALENKPDKPEKKHRLKKKSKDSEPKRTIKDLSDEELSAMVRRLELEKRYRDLNPKQVSAGKKFMTETILPKATKTITDVAAEYATKKAKEYLGLEKKDATQELKKKVEKLDLNKRYKDLTTEDPLKELRSEANRLTLEKTIRALREEEEKREGK